MYKYAVHLASRPTNVQPRVCSHYSLEQNSSADGTQASVAHPGTAGKHFHLSSPSTCVLNCVDEPESDTCISGAPTHRPRFNGACGGGGAVLQHLAAQTPTLNTKASPRPCCFPLRASGAAVSTAGSHAVSPISSMCACRRPRPAPRREGYAA